MSHTKFRLTSGCLAVFLGAIISCRAQDSQERSAALDQKESAARASAILAGGCFWCVETDFDKLPGVVNVISGYSGGRTKEPTYKNYSSGGHREVVFITYDPTEITYAGLVEYLIKHIDPTNRRGQFKDNGLQYSPAAYYENPEEKQAAERVIKAIDGMKIYRGRVGIAVKPRKPFWPAEEYHQDYHQKNSLKYNFFRLASGRDAFVNKHWGARASVLELPGAFPDGKEPKSDTRAKDVAASDNETEKWKRFVKPKPAMLKKRLSAMQYKVTQRDGTETAFRNTYWDNKKEGIYVDVVSGAPLFSSKDKFKSGTGWPSFVRPIENDAVTFKVDRNLFGVRTEVRSRYGDSHLGHVFSDGPPQRGGKRYCMNSASLRFVPKEKLDTEGYGDFLPLFGGNAAN